MKFYAAEPSYFASFHEGVPDDGMKSCHVDTSPSSYCYGGGPYDFDDSGKKKLVKDLGLPIAKINACKNGCMLYWKDDVDLEHYIFCGDARYKPSRGRDYGRTYSCWPVIITPYNLRPGMCMSFEYMFLTMVIPGPSNPKRLIDVYMELLIEELLQLWHVGVGMYNHDMNKAFIMQATLMWTVNDLPAYGRNKKTFTKNRVENKVARPRITGDQILDQVAHISPQLKCQSLPDGYGSDHKLTKKASYGISHTGQCF
ncbi:UNVERIFIED_CONTAM: hypothetical protein Scaly_1012600 [Sesamum calycinum]|uniref:Uncharacterized protein n=1 Tax=Sesamum calycinum TaxID=2727403 RepID=A0AAW2QKL3_9LAMI